MDHDCWTVNEAKTLDLMKQGRQTYKIFDNMIKDMKLVTLTHRIMNVYCKKIAFTIHVVSPYVHVLL